MDFPLYPPFDVPRIGGGLLIAVVAITHIVIAHAAVGAGLYNAIGETLARRRGDALLLRFLQDNTRFLVLIPFVLGVVTGVGIWFTLSVVSPRAISALIHNFVWAWAIEWVLFAVEIAAGYVYYYGWDRLTPRQHVIVGWIYAITAWLSLFVINGILSFMLSPAGDVAPGTFDLSRAFFNPTFWPSLLLRTVSSLALASLFCCVGVNLLRGYSRAQRTAVINFSAWFLLPLALMPPLAWWWFQGVPAESRRLVFGGATAMTLFFAFGMVASLLLAGYAYVGLLRMRRYINLETSVLLCAIALIATGSMEFVREGIRKPYLITGYLWANGISTAPREAAALAEDGILAHATWITGPEPDLAALDEAAKGRLVFRAQCARCHIEDGYNDVRPLIATWRADMIRTVLDELHERKPIMPPFHGTDAEKDWLTTYLHGGGE